MESTFDVIVVGAGAAGLLAAISAAESGASVLVLEKNRKPGVKILMSGGTRCNVTQDTDHRGIVTTFGRQGRFLKSAVGKFGPNDIIELLAAEGVPTKVESTGKIFPASNRAFDVLQGILSRLHRTDSQILSSTAVQDIAFDNDTGQFKIDCLSDSGKLSFQGKNVILTTGGMSYPGCGTTGDGYSWAKSFGHAIVPPQPALVPLRLDDDWISDLSGITIPDATIRVTIPPDKHHEARGALLFTHFGISGPSVLDVSRAITTSNIVPSQLVVELDLTPTLSKDELDRMLRQSTAGKRSVGNVISEVLPRRIVNVVCTKAKSSNDTRLAELPRQERTQLIQNMKAMRVRVTGTMGFKKAEVTAGGVSLDSVDPKTMSSKLQVGLYFAGEILDIDGPIGGYNFQAAFSTGWLAGKSIAKRIASTC